MSDDDSPDATEGAIRALLRERRERIGPYVKARHVATALGVPVQFVTPRLSALVDAGDLEVWSDVSPRTYRITLDDGTEGTATTADRDGATPAGEAERASLDPDGRGGELQ